MKKTIKMYLHSSKDSNYDLINRFNLEFADEDAETTFLYALYEVEFDVEVDLDTGKEKIISVNGRKLLDDEDQTKRQAD